MPTAPRLVTRTPAIAGIEPDIALINGFTTQALAESGLGRNEGYSGALRALARLSMDGLWLTRIQFAEKDGEVAIAGFATHPERVAAYLERLRGEEALRGQAFSRLEIRRPPSGERPGVVEFLLSSSPAGRQEKK